MALMICWPAAVVVSWLYALVASWTNWGSLSPYSGRELVDLLPSARGGVLHDQHRVTDRSVRTRIQRKATHSRDGLLLDLDHLPGRRVDDLPGLLVADRDAAVQFL